MRILISIIMMITPTMAHDWYPTSCCSDRDCYEIPATEVEPTSTGWRIKKTGEIMKYFDRRLKKTPEIAGATYHRCSRRNGDPEANTICLFVPPMGY